MPQLSDSQLVVLTAACQRPDRCVFPITARLKGNAAGNVLKSLLKKGLIKEVRAKRDDTVYRHDEERGRITLIATNAAFAAIGIDPEETPAEDETVNAAAPADSPKTPSKPKSRASRTAALRRRDGSKQAQLIAMLRRAKGATIDEIVEALGWQPHTVRGRDRRRAEEEAQPRCHLRERRKAGANLSNRKRRLSQHSASFVQRRVGLP
jgi:Protein of unknown function (DUF3489)